MDGRRGETSGGEGRSDGEALPVIGVAAVVDAGGVAVAEDAGDAVVEGDKSARAIIIVTVMHIMHICPTPIVS